MLYDDDNTTITRVEGLFIITIAAMEYLWNLPKI